MKDYFSFGKKTLKLRLINVSKFYSDTYEILYSDFSKQERLDLILHNKNALKKNLKKIPKHNIELNKMTISKISLIIEVETVKLGTLKVREVFLYDDLNIKIKYPISTLSIKFIFS